MAKGVSTSSWNVSVRLHHYLPVLHDVLFATTLIQRQSMTNNLQARRGRRQKNESFV